MIIKDEIYGTFDIQEPVLEELVETNSIQRLKGIHQGGASYLVNENWNVTRFEHSVGVMLFIRRMGGTVEEQIAGLLHDVSHTAFSHVIDYVMQEEKEDYHERIFKEIVYQSNIPSIIKKHGYDVEPILDETNWRLLEQPLPDLCADRIDYTLRDMYHYQGLSIKGVEDFLQSLQFDGHVLYLTDIHIAEWFVRWFYCEVIDFFMHPLNVHGSQRLKELLKTALTKQVITMEDFLLQDEEVLELIRLKGDKDLHNMLTHLEEDVTVIEDKENYEFHQKNKLRYIDPLVLSQDNTLHHISKLSEEVKHETIKAKAQSEKGTYVRKVK
ncbi:HD domain-containing protein [Pontibacillus yanchengensis]|uniref:HD domain-containing protein n=2 Tax=Pontibacillus yanchengensis TaxID=462910 RepID=A0ACC7VFR0_9BACI|nr:HD domain-containing protein [Pontibacillus yanchengensis]MYL52994.1 HD domain-containing protein [Pontibacillus yanchengensis]